MALDQKPSSQGDKKLSDVFFLSWHYARVVETEDPYRAGRIKVEIPGIDTDIKWVKQKNGSSAGSYRPIEELPWCEPLMPKYINIVPKIGEYVKVAVHDIKNKKQRREYIGPIISQQRPPNFERPDSTDADKVQNNSDKQYYPSWLKTGAKVEDGDWKIYPDLDDISFIGRSNTDFILRDKKKYNEVLLRAGKMDYKFITQGQIPSSSSGAIGGTFPLNEKNPAYITINFSLPSTGLQGVSSNAANSLNLWESRSHINLVADNLNFISHKGSNIKGLSPSILSGDKVSEQIRVETEKLHPLVYGDVLWEFLTVLKPFLLNHIHKGSRREPDGDVTKNNLENWFKDNMGDSTEGDREKNDFKDCTFLSKGVKTN